MADVFAEMKSEPFWWQEAPRKYEPTGSMPETADVVIVGSGFSGLCTARILAKAGKSVVVCESGFPGFGASTRNGGMLGPSFHKLGVQGLKAHYGEERTHGILNESIGFVDFIRTLIEEDDIDCDFQQTGRFRGACKPAHYEQMAQEIDEQIRATGIEAEAIPASEVRSEIGTDLFHGGIRYHIDGGLHPAKYHDGLVRVVHEAGAQVVARTEVTGIDKTTSGFRVTSSAGTVMASQIAICTNGYTGKVTPWFRKRVLPIRSSLIATEELDEHVMNALMPTGRCYGDSRRIMAYYRPSPDGKRILFGGRATSGDKPLANARKLRQSMLELFPDLENVRISHSWSGLVAYAFDHVPHLGEHDGMFYAMGYCGSGVARASYFGTKLGHKMLGETAQGSTAFDDLAFDSRPLYTGNPWFMSPIIQWHRALDRLGL
jgi:glycine/D-amino acid oxidase-like deaminating enzyme